MGTSQAREDGGDREGSSGEGETSAATAAKSPELDRLEVGKTYRFTVIHACLNLLYVLHSSSRYIYIYSSQQC